MPEFLTELRQFLCGDVTVFGLETFSVLSAQVFYDGEIRSALGAIQTFAHFRQKEMAALPDLRTVSVDGDPSATG
jgi:hypothetical protein